MLYPIILVHLQPFFNESKLRHLAADSTFAIPLNVVVPGFNIYTNNFKHRIAADKSLHWNMKKMAQAAKQDERIYQSLTEPLLDGLLDIRSTFPSTNDILTICSMTIAGL